MGDIQFTLPVFHVARFQKFNFRQKMNTLLVIFAICVASTLGLTDEQKVRLKGHKEFCIAETGVDPAVVENARTGVMAEGEESFDCFAACFLKRVGILDEAGNIHDDIFRSKAGISQEQIDAIINRCKSLTGATACQTAGAVFKCFLATKSFDVLF